jgi:hypothetical protein
VSEYSNFEFEIGKPNGDYRARVIESSVGDGQECQFSWPTLDADLSNLLRVLRDSNFSRSQSRSAAVSLSSPVVPDIRHLAIGHEEVGLPEVRVVARRTLEEFGRQLFDRVFAGTVREALRSSAEKAKDQGLRLRIRLRLDNVPEFHDVPWEYLFDTSPPGEFMLHWKERSLVRYLSLPNPIRPLTLETELKVLVMISSPAGVTPLNVEDEWTKLEGALKTSGSQRIVLDRLENATLPALMERLRDQSYHAFHFIGHGGFEDDEGILLLEDSNGEKRAVRADQIGAILRNHESLRLVVLNACEGARTSNHDPFAGVAQRLVGLGVPVVVAMQYEISDQAAITFSSNFYAVLAKGHSVDAAMTEARLAIFTSTDSEFEFGIPVLHMRLEDGQIFMLPEQSSEPVVDPSGQTDVLLPEKGSPIDDVIKEVALKPGPPSMIRGPIPDDSKFFVERDSDRQAIGLIQQFGGVTVTIKGPSQMGKSSLLARMLASARAIDKRPVFLDFAGWGNEARSKPEIFFRQFASSIGDKLDLEDKTEEHWARPIPDPQRCSRYFSKHILTNLETQNTSLVLALDEVDSMLASTFRNDFFGMLRAWTVERAVDPLWKRLDLILITSSEPYDLIGDLYQSPFNVGTTIELENFTLAQLGELNQRYQSPLRDPADLKRLFDLIAGHPFLSQQALFSLASESSKASDLFALAASENGPFKEHLQFHLGRIKAHPELEKGLQEILVSGTCQDEHVASRLRDAGLVMRRDNRWVTHCPLYADFFKARLGIR